MNIRARLDKLEATRDSKSVQDMTDAELEECIAELTGLPKGSPISDEMILKICNDSRARDVVGHVVRKINREGGSTLPLIVERKGWRS